MSPPEGTPEHDTDSAITFGLAPNTRAYSVNAVGRLAQMTYGRFMATLNAETYTQVAIGMDPFPQGRIVSLTLKQRRC